jgi:hypothetical protein
VSNPELLVLDEPTVAMDVGGRHAFWRVMREFAGGGKTIVFATHYLEEADSYADRVVLMAHGRIVADGPPNEIKAMVGSKTIRATLPGADLDELARLPGVTAADSRGEAVVLACSDSDAAIRALLARYPEARDIEVGGAGLEEAFLQSLGFPLVIYYMIAAPNRNVSDLSGSGLSAPLYFMCGLAAFGTMSAMLSSGGAPSAGTASSGSRRSRPATTSGPRSSPATRWRSPAYCCSTPRARPSASRWRRASGCR